MRPLLLTIAFLMAALPARAQAIAPGDARTHVGEPVTVEASVSAVHVGRSGVTFIDMGGRFPDNTFAAVIFADDAAKFPNVSALEGKKVEISGPVVLYRGRPEIILNSADQLKTNRARRATTVAHVNNGGADRRRCSARRHSAWALAGNAAPARSACASAGTSANSRSDTQRPQAAEVVRRFAVERIFGDGEAGAERAVPCCSLRSTI